MAIEGPLRELGIHDVFQLLDLSRKTGTLRVVSELRDNDGTVLFEKGRIISAAIRSNPHRIGDLLVRSGRLTAEEMTRAQQLQREGDKRRLGEILVALGMVTPKEIERQVKLQIEAVVFELMSWREGHFRFEEGLAEDLLRDAVVPLSPETLLMEGARRIDEWSRIADRVPNLSVIPELSPADEDHPAMLDLLPQEWQVLSMIDGEHDLREIAAALAMSDFDVAKVVYGLVTTGVIRLYQPRRASQVTPIPSDATPTQRRTQSRDGRSTPLDPTAEPVRRGAAAFRRGDFAEGIAVWEAFVATATAYGGLAGIREGLDAAVRLQAVLDREVPLGR